MDAATPNQPTLFQRLSNSFAKVKNTDNWPTLLRKTLLFKGSLLIEGETMQRLEAQAITGDEDSFKEVLHHLQRDMDRRTARIVASMTITGILTATQSAVFVGFMLNGDVSTSKDVAVVLDVMALCVAVWSLISGLQYLVLPFTDALDKAMESAKSPQKNLCRLLEYVHDYNAKAMLIGMSQEVSGILLILSTLSLALPYAQRIVSAMVGVVS